MPRGDESSPGSKRLEKEMHEQFLEPQEAGMLKTGLVSGYRWEFTFCQEKTVTLWHQHGVVRNASAERSQETVRAKDPSRTPVTRSSR